MAPTNRQTQNRQRVLTGRRRSSEINRAINRLSNNLVRLNIPRNKYNLGTITKANNRYMSVRLSRKLIDNLKEIYFRTWTRQVEYAGTIPFTINNTRNYVKFNTPTAHTNNRIANVTPTQEELTQYIVYHTHPVPENELPLFTYPSEPDLRAYINAYPQMQANLILENQGYYIIDLIETNMNKPNPNRVIQIFNELMNGYEFRRVSVPRGRFQYYTSTPEKWKRTINKYIDPIMRKQFGISIRYYTWSELGVITLLDKNVIMNVDT